MAKGTIKWFSPAKGYGFITREDGEDVFLHASQLISGQDRHLFPGDEMEFSEIDGEKGIKATEAKCLTPSQLPKPAGASKQGAE